MARASCRTMRWLTSQRNTGVCPMQLTSTLPPEEAKHMAKILADKDIKKLLGTVILNADEKRINPNGIEIRLGKHVLFQSTDEEKELSDGTYLKVLPGESVTIASFEDFTFTREAIDKVFPGCDL